MRRKIVKLVAIIFLFLFCFLSYENITTCYAEETKTQEQIEKELNDNVDGVIDDFDFSALDQFLLNLKEDDKIFFDASTFSYKLKQILSGEFADGYSSLFKAVLNLFFDNLVGLIPTFALLIAIGIISSLFTSLKPNSKGVGDIIHLVCFGVIAIIVVKYVCDFIALTLSVLKGISILCDSIFPILLTLVSTMGGVVSGKVYQPVVLVFCNVIIKLFSTVLISLFVFAFVFSLLSSFSTRLKFKKFSDFFTSTFKWILGIVFFLFMAYLSLQGITASMFDSMKIRTAKFAVRSYVPLLGGYLSEGFDFILSSLSLVKNAVGIAGILLLLSFVIVPILKMVMFSLGLKLVGAVCEPICDERITNFVSNVSKNLTLLISLLIGASFMFLIIVGLVVLTFNAV